MPKPEAVFEKLALLQAEINNQLYLEPADLELAIIKVIEYRKLLLSISSETQYVSQVNQQLEWLNTQVKRISNLKTEVMAEITQLNRARTANASYDINK
ncbi:hypothetical protein [Rheinheimera sp. WS51]|uniref:hypothetical protein n=1 Tax=Rheinheimera sp. WS51 TaxID=3425886 RepID=UPI003D90CE30